MEDLGEVVVDRGCRLCLCGFSLFRNNASLKTRGKARLADGRLHMAGREAAFGCPLNLDGSSKLSKKVAAECEDGGGDARRT